MELPKYLIKSVTLPTIFHNEKQNLTKVESDYL